jgi:2-amino-4-hydroxy-6-hydroxymethyldihydropteridine diphosphokinase
MMPPSRRVAIALGSNLGDRRAAILTATERLSGLISSLTLSEIVETEPEGVSAASNHPDYLNAVLVGETTLGARDLLDALLQIESDLGRERPYVGAPRTLDLDLVLLGEEILDEPGLQVPHPRFRNRFFVLGPMAEVAPDLRDPVTGMSVTELLRQLLRDESR